MSVTESPDAFQSIDRIATRLGEAYTPDVLYDNNEQRRYDELIVQLEKESRGLILSRIGDETPLEETGREDEMRATDDASMPLVYPVNDVTSVEVKHTLRSDWEQLDEWQWDFSSHRIILENRRNVRSVRRHNPLTEYSDRATWRDFCTKMRVTYDRGWDDVPSDLLNAQIQIITGMLRNMRNEQSISAMEPDQISAVVDARTVMTESVKDQIDTVTKLGGATLSV